jgi:hypothetical protein
MFLVIITVVLSVAFILTVALFCSETREAINKLLKKFEENKPSQPSVVDLPYFLAWDQIRFCDIITAQVMALLGFAPLVSAALRAASLLSTSGAPPQPLASIVGIEAPVLLGLALLSFIAVRWRVEMITKKIPA